MSNPQSTISINDFVALEQASKVTVIDVRTTAEVNSEYFDGAYNLPVQEITPEKLQSLLDANGCSSEESVYLLCGSGQRAYKAAEQMTAVVANPLVVIEGGIRAMQQAGVNLKKGAGATISLERQVRIAAGSFVVLGAVMGASIHPAFYGLSAFVGAGLVFTGVTDTCGMATALARMPWNRAA